MHVVRVDAFGPYWIIPSDPPSIDAFNDHADHMMIWESTDNDLTWSKHGDAYGTFGTYGEMYPRFLKLQDGRFLLTFTVRAATKDGYPLGLRAIVSYDDGETWDFNDDRLVIDYKTPLGSESGGGYGNTIQLANGTLVSTYSYRGNDNQFHIEVVRWSLPASK